MASEEEISVPENELTRPHRRPKASPRFESAFRSASRLSRPIYFTLLHHCYVIAGNPRPLRFLFPRRASISEKDTEGIRRESGAILIPGCTIWRAFRGFRLQIISRLRIVVFTCARDARPFTSDVS